MARRMLREHPLSGLLSDLPKLLLQYKMQQDEADLTQARIDAEKDLQLAQTWYTHNESIKRNLDDERKVLLETYDELEEGISAWGPVSDLFDNISDIERTIDSDLVPVKWTNDHLDMLSQMTDNNLREQNMLKQGNAALTKTINNAKTISRDLSYLQDVVDSKKVNPWLAGDMGSVDKDDLAVYFDTALTGDFPGQFSADPWSPNFTENYNDYRAAFLTRDPGYTEDIASRENIRQIKEAQRQTLTSLVDDTYNSMVLEAAQISENYPGGLKAKSEAWSHILYGEDSKETVPVEVAGWLSESMKKTKGGKSSGEEFLRWLDTNPNGPATKEWLMQNPYWADRITTIEQRMSDFYDPYQGGPTDRDLYLGDAINAIITGEQGITPSKDPEVIWEHFRKEAAGLGKIEQGDLYNNLLDAATAAGMPNLKDDINLMLGIKAGDAQMISEAYDEDMQYYKARQSELLERQQDGLMNDNESEELNKVNAKISQLESALESTKLNLRGLDESSLFVEDGGRKTASQVISDLQTVDPLDRMFQYKPGYGGGDPMNTPGYPGGFDPEYFESNFLTSPFSEIDGDSNPYVEGFQEHLEDVWDEMYETISTEDRDYLGPDFLSTMGRNPARLIRDYTTDEELTAILKEADLIGKSRAENRIQEILADPAGNQEDYTEILEALRQLQ